MDTDIIDEDIQRESLEEKSRGKSVKEALTQIRISAMNILAGREHSIAEMRQKLQRKLNRRETNTESDLGKSDLDKPELDKPERIAEQIEVVLAQLLAEKLLDEARFTEAFIRSRINKGSGPIKIRHELKNRGIAGEMVDDYMENAYDFWQVHIKAARNKRFGNQLPKDYKEQSKQSRFLYQRGFSGELIQRLFADKY